MSDRRTFLTTLGALLASAGLSRAAMPAPRRDRIGELLPMRPLGRTGQEVTMLGLGGWHIGRMSERDAQATGKAVLLDRNDLPHAVGVPLDDVPADLLIGRTRTGRSIHGRAPETLWSLHSRSQSASTVEMKFRAGTHVRHQVWGEGIVLDSRIQDDDEIVDVVFESVGIKRLAASLANLSIVK